MHWISHPLAWRAGPPPEPREGGLVAGVGLNVPLQRLAVDPEGKVPPPAPRAHHIAGPQLTVEVLAPAPDPTARPCGRIRLPR